MDFKAIFSNAIGQIQSFIPVLNTGEFVVSVFEVILLGILLYYIYQRYIKGTSSENLVKGAGVLIILWLVAEILVFLRLQVFGMFLKGFVTIVIFGLIIVFQPELRRLLSYLGQGNLLNRVLTSKTSKNEKSDSAKDVRELVETIKYLARTKTGALFVIKTSEGFANTYEVGTEINADISQELLLTIFHPNTPLHDGAVVITNGKIQVAGALLPLTDDPKLSWRYGTRHRAAIGASESSDCACIVVSEETGDVSFAVDGVLKKCEDLGQLKTTIERIMGVEKEDEEQVKNFFFKKKSL